VSLKMVGTTLGPASADVAVFSPDNNLLTLESVHGENKPEEMISLSRAVTLPVTGTYTILIAPSELETDSDRPRLFKGAGTVAITLYDVPPDATATITPDGPPVTVATTIVGQEARLTFNGTAGQVISLKGMNPTFVPIAPSVAPSIDIRLYQADGTFLERADITLFVRHLILPETGSYTIVLRVFSAEAGSLALKMYNVPADITNTISANGSPVTVTTTVPGQDIRLTFSGSANQKISLKIGNPYIFRSLESISGPDFQL